ncbi:hypothetical protein [Arsenicicoccus piscis]|uniref:SAF domain-containing protein n=1 Tax=Arsenicicoccus piscis TaxID=673954 RepID=A0ABQ6HU13_9MICO|nr:hypothetical protein [Arsenicicoccus piscis]GMA21188.1 hypothetical protein GCM10025862_32090 [Arsenicicoccus piscis]
MGERRMRGRGGAEEAGASSAWAPVLGLVGLSAASLAAFTAIGVASMGPQPRTVALDTSTVTTAPSAPGSSGGQDPAGDSSRSGDSPAALPPTATHRLDAGSWVKHGTPAIGTPLLAVGGGPAVGVGEIAAAPLFLPGSLGQLTQADVLAAGSRSVTEGSALAALQGTFLLGPQLAGVQVLASDAGVKAATTVRAGAAGSTSTVEATAVMAALAPVASTLVAAGAAPDTPLVAIAALAPGATDQTLTRQAVIAAAAVPSAAPTDTLAGVAAMARSAIEPADGSAVARTQAAPSTAPPAASSGASTGATAPTTSGGAPATGPSAATGSGATTGAGSTPGSTPAATPGRVAPRQAPPGLRLLGDGDRAGHCDHDTGHRHQRAGHQPPDGHADRRRPDDQHSSHHAGPHHDEGDPGADRPHPHGDGDADEHRRAGCPGPDAHQADRWWRPERLR